jgi:hypothetical protein
MSSYHFGANEYNHLIGRTLGGKLSIINIEYIPDNNYTITDGYFGNPYLLTLSNEDTFKFRQFTEVIKKYGGLSNEISNDLQLSPIGYT